MALILDTNALSAFAGGDRHLRRGIDQETDLALPTVVLGEYIFGIRQSRHRKQYEEWLRDHLRFFLVLSIGSATAERYAEIRSELKMAGQPIPSNDVWIAALAREHRLKLVTRDRHFDSIRGLSVVGW
jgi:tRNA(fMet)-specific endonuclease VapC